jgi:hypothetical protein
MNWRRWLGMDRRGLVVIALLAVPAAGSARPSLLPWGWHGQVGRYDVYAVSQPDPRLTAELGRAEALVAASPINDPAIRPTLYLTDGGWRWHLLTPLQGQTFAITRATLDGTILNRSDIAADAIYARGYKRTLSGVVAHETTHVMQRHRLGLARYGALPTWVREGYADYVARESTLDDAAVARLRSEGRNDPAIFYHDARLRVAAALAGGESVGQLLARKD